MLDDLLNITLDDMLTFIGGGLLRLGNYDFQLFQFHFSCNKNFDNPFWVPSAGKKCLTIKSRGIALHDNDNMVS